jgi:hypothetical protein
MRGRDLVGCGLVAGGMGVFLSVSPPSSGRSDASVREWLPVFGIVVVLCLAAVTMGHGRGEAMRAGLIAAAAGVVFGLTAAVTLSLARLVRGVGVPAFLGHWQPWALITLGLAGLLLAQSAFQAGQLTASLPIIDTVEPLSGVLIGTAVFHEQLAASPSILAIQLSGAAVAVAGIALLAPSAASLADGVTDPGRDDRAATPA